MALGEPDESGRPRPTAVEGDDALVEVSCDRLLLAVGQDGDLSLFPTAVETFRGPLFVDGAPAPIYVCGDLAGGEGTVSAAIGSGRRAALAIHAAIAGSQGAGGAGSLAAERPDDATLAGPEIIHPQAFPKIPREQVSFLAPRLRRRDFAEVRRGFSTRAGHDALRAEAARCFSCGACTGCDLCVIYCPEGVVRHAEGCPPEADYDYCKGCGLCAAACPRGVLFTEAI